MIVEVTIHPRALIKRRNRGFHRYVAYPTVTQAVKMDLTSLPSHKPSNDNVGKQSSAYAMPKWWACLIRPPKTGFYHSAFVDRIWTFREL